MKKNYLLLSLLAVTITVGAEQRSVDEAREIAYEKMGEIGIAGNDTLVENISKAKKRTNGRGESVEPYYVFAGDKGFVIVSGESAMPDIVGYSSEGVYDEETIPDGLVYFLDAYAEMAISVSSGDNSAIRRIMASRALRQASVTAVSPLLGDIEWAQSEPYNSMCPVLSGSETVTGCVATAMGQIMMYHQWPETLQEDIPSYQYKYILNSADNNADTVTVTIGAIEAGYAYDWDNMLPTYSGSYTDEEAYAVGALLFHCGASCGMKYYPWSTSSATNPYQQFVTYFGYDADTNQPLYAETYNLADWNEMIQSELTNGRPVLYTGSTSADEGHAFVLDGVDSEGLYHVNWGWEGDQNGYYDITLLNPEKGGTGSGEAEDGYTRSCYMIVGITPDDGVEGDAYYYQPGADISELSSISITDGSRSSASETFSLSLTYKITNYTSDSFTGRIAVGLVNSDGSVERISSQTSVIIPARGATSYVAYTCDFSFKYAFPTGNSTLTAIYSDDGGETWNMCGGGEYYAVVLNATDTTLTEVDRTVSVTVEAEEELLAKTTNQLKLTAINNLAVEFIGDLYVYISDSDSQPDDYDESSYLRIPSGDSTSVYMDIYIDDADAIYVWVEDEFGNLLVDGQQMSVTANEEAELTLLSFATNASETDYDTENCYYSGCVVKVPKVYSDTLFITWTIENTGGIYRGTLETNSNEQTSTSSNVYNTLTLRSVSVTIPASSTYEHKDTLLSSEFDSPYVFCHLFDEDNEMEDIDEFYKLYLASSSYLYFPMSSRDVMVYFSDSDENVGISDIVSSSAVSIRGCDGYICISAAESATITIYTLGGRLVKTVDLDLGGSATVNVPAGVYIADGKKIIVK